MHHYCSVTLTLEPLGGSRCPGSAPVGPIRTRACSPSHQEEEGEEGRAWFPGGAGSRRAIRVMPPNGSGQKEPRRCEGGYVFQPLEISRADFWELRSDSAATFWFCTVTAVLPAMRWPSSLSLTEEWRWYSAAAGAAPLLDHLV